MAASPVNLGVNLAESEPDQESLGWGWMLLYLSLALLLFLTLLIFLLKLFISFRYGSQLKHWGLNASSVKPVLVGFFHPYCHAGGGGERVLWQSISALQKRYSFIKCVIYAGFQPDLNSQQILDKVQCQFGIHLHDEVRFVCLHRRKWVEPGCWPHLTILGQSLGSLVLGFEAMLKFSPNVFVDTTGYAFVVPLFRWLGGCHTISYVHYPTVSQDMLEKVRQNECAHNNSAVIGRSKFLTNLKMFYYRLYAKIYGFAGRRNDIVMVNSTWTHGHIAKIWRPRKLYIVYPPCDTTSFLKIPIKRSPNKFGIISIGQFRPEKNHQLQLEIMKDFVALLDKKDKKKVELVLLGSCRNNEDTQRVIELKKTVKKFYLEPYVRFETNVAFDRLKEELGMASAALHTMWNEHFGIGLVECMAAGCVMIGHNSGGPQMDIVVEWKGQQTGYLATVKEGYVAWLLEVFHMKEEDRDVMVSSAREAVRSKFSVEVFEMSFLRATEHLFTDCV